MSGYFHTLHNFLNMGGYAVYVWSAYAIALILIGWNILVAKKQYHHIIISLCKKISPSQRVDNEIIRNSK